MYGPHENHCVTAGSEASSSSRGASSGVAYRSASSGPVTSTAPMVYTARMLALLYDVHGNLPALDAVLADAADAGATRYVLGGDYALFGAWPAETVARLRELDNALWIRGNGERWAHEVEAAPDNPVVRGAIAAVRAALGAELVVAMHEIAALAEDRGALICHGSPPSDVRSFLCSPRPGSARAASSSDSTSSSSCPAKRGPVGPLKRCVSVR